MSTAAPAETDRAPRAARSRLHPAAWSLRAKLVAAILALFLAVSAATGALTLVSLDRSLMQQTDSELVKTSSRLDHGRGPRPPPGGGSDNGPAGSGILRLVYTGSTVSENSAVSQAGQFTQLSVSQFEQLADAGLGWTPRTVDLGGDLGEYRLVAVTQPDGDTAVTGLPMAPQRQTLSRLRDLVLVGTALGALAVGLGGTLLVRSNLRPLQRLAELAARVSRQRLDSGDVALAERVPVQDTDARTEVGQVGLALNSMLDNVDGALRARQESEQKLRRFVADASHELRTPLASIRGYAELSRREREPVPASVTHALGRIESEGMRMTGLVEDLLLLARLDAGRPLDRRPVDLTMMCIQAVGDMHAASPDHRWELDLPGEPIEIPGDQARLTQVVVNLLGNARTHTPAGTRVVTSLRRVGQQVRLSVQDNGPGVAPELQETVFERFTRGDEARTRTGGSTGLGLSIVSSVVTAHGGRVELDSRPGETAFSVLLPAS